MAQYTVDHTCGHSHSYNLFGKHDDRDRKIDWLSRQACPRCRESDGPVAYITRHLHDGADAATVDITNSFEVKDLLRSRGYRFGSERVVTYTGEDLKKALMSRPQPSWFIDLEPQQIDDEIAWIREQGWTVIERRGLAAARAAVAEGRPVVHQSGERVVTAKGSRMMPAKEEILNEPAGRRLDAWVHEFVMGLSPVVGEAHCWAPDGSWSVCGGNGSSGGTELRPVYQTFFPDEKYLGHHSDSYGKRFGETAGVCNLWLKPVLWYSTNPGDAWGALQHLLLDGNINYDICGFGLSDVRVDIRKGCGPELNYSQCWSVEAKADTMPLALCRAVLLAKRTLTQGEDES